MGRHPRTLAVVVLSLWLAATACGGSSTGGSGGTGSAGIRGIVTIGPMCPAIQANSPCPDKPYSTQMTIADPSGKVVANTTSGVDGTFNVALSPGTYVVSVAGSMPGASGISRNVTVRPGAWSSVAISVDSGIR